MTAPHALRDLAALIENIGDADLSIDGVRTPEGSLVDGQTLSAELTVRLDWGSLDDVGSAVSVAPPDDVAVESDESGVAFPMDVEIAADDGAAETEPVAESAKTQVTDGGVAIASALSDEAEQTAEADEERNDESGPGDRDAETVPESESENDREVESDCESETAESGTDRGRDVETGTDHGVEARGTGTDPEAEAADGERESEGSADATPEPHRDPERLREAYESCETFPEMAEALGTSVTPQTVRYHAIELGIHRPNERNGSAGRSDAESADDESVPADSESGEVVSQTEAQSSTSETETRANADEAENAPGTEREAPETPDQHSDPAPESEATERDEETERSDGEGDSRPPELQAEDLPSDVDLPSHVSLADLRDAVRSATTLYEVQRDLRVDRSAARGLLRDLDLLDLVTGRAATADERSVSAAAIDERIRRACT